MSLSPVFYHSVEWVQVLLSITNNLIKHQSFVFVCFVLRHINLIGHLMPNQFKENKSEKKFKEILEINDKL